MVESAMSDARMCVLSLVSELNADRPGLARALRNAISRIPKTDLLEERIAELRERNRAEQRARDAWEAEALNQMNRAERAEARVRELEEGLHLAKAELEIAWED